MSEKSLHELTQALRSFAAERDWEQFHSPKNLAMALAVEASELMEHFQWLREDASRDLPESTRREVEEEMADVLLYLLRMADVLDVDLVAAAVAKMEKNGAKYPAHKVRGRADKYDKY
jgi:NTP pyrophosphatase (non-canonical NTP hydrolase)